MLHILWIHSNLGLGLGLWLGLGQRVRIRDRVSATVYGGTWPGNEARVYGLQRFASWLSTGEGK